MRPLDDIRIVALEQYGAGPFGSLQLAHLGADVIKIEDPLTGGDSGRNTPTYSEDGHSLFFEARNRNKRSLNLDLRSAAGREVFEDLIRRSDAIYSNLRGDAPGRLKIRYDDLKALNAQIVCCSLSGFGMTGPRTAEPAYDYILQAIAGWMSLTGPPHSPPEKAGLSLVDCSGGFVAALSLLAGIHAARRTGTGMDCDVSLFDTAISLLSYQATWLLTAGYRPSKTARSSHPTIVPCQLYRARDEWLIIMCPKEKFWRRLTDILELPDLLHDPRFADMTNRRHHREELQAIIDEKLMERPADEWLTRFHDASIPSARVNSMEQALADAHTIAREMIVSTEHPIFGRVSHVNSAVRVGPQRTVHTRAPFQGEHRDAILNEILGYSSGRIDDLASAGAFGPAG